MSMVISLMFSYKSPSTDPYLYKHTSYNSLLNIHRMHRVFTSLINSVIF